MDDSLEYIIVRHGLKVTWEIVPDRASNEDNPLAAIPNILGPDVKPCPLFFVRAAEGEALSGQGLETGFEADIGAHLS